MANILGLDPGLNHVGYGILSYDEKDFRITDFKYGVFKIKEKATEQEKLVTAFLQAQELVEKYQIQQASMEVAFHNAKFAKGGVIVREAMGSLKSALGLMGVPVKTFNPQQVKMAATGKGKAEKIEVTRAVCQILGIKEFELEKTVRKETHIVVYTPEQLIEKKEDHASDALAVALCLLKTLQEEALKEVVPC